MANIKLNIFEDLLPSFRNLVLSGTSVAPTSQVHVFITLLLLIVGN